MKIILFSVSVRTSWAVKHIRVEIITVAQRNPWTVYLSALVPTDEADLQNLEVDNLSGFCVFAMPNLTKSVQDISILRFVGA